MRKRNVKESSESANNAPSWLQGNGASNDIRARNQNRNPKHKQVRSESRDGLLSESDSDAIGGGRLGKDRERADTTRSRQARRGKRKTKAVVDEGTGNRRVTSKISMEALRQALSDEDLQSLLDRDYLPTKIISISQEVQRTTFAEDFYMVPPVKKVIKRVKGKTPKKAIPPSERYKESIQAFRFEGAEPNAEVALGHYFILYKRFFHEEDPEWAGASSHKAVQLVEQLANDVTDGDYRKIINFIRKILPLWVARLKRGEEFPSSRPTVHTLFGGSRYFWKNRNILYRQWDER